MKRQGRQEGRRRTPGGPQREWLFGRQIVAEVLHAGRRNVHRVVVGEWVRSTKPIQEIQELAEARKVHLDSMTQDQLRTCVGTGNHQGIAVEVSPYPYVGLDALLCDADPGTMLLVLDHLEDVHNVGALLRTAEAVGVAGVVMPKDRAAGVTPAAVRASAGASEHMRVARVTNLAQAVRTMKQEGVTVVGLEADAKAMVYSDCSLEGPLALVVGSEGHGMKRLVREACDGLIRIPLHGRVTSLNASVAGGIVLYELRKHMASSEIGERQVGVEDVHGG